MIWRDARAPATGEIDPERELELRLITHVHAGAAWALSSLVARYQPPVVRYLIRLTGDPERAHALAEQVFVRMARRLRGPHRGEHLRLWLLRTATEVGLDVLRRPASNRPAQLAAPARAPALLPGQVRKGPVARMLHAIGGRSQTRNAQRPVPPTQEFVWSGSSAGQTGHAQMAETLSPREQVRHRLIRAVLAELTYSEAQCLALHLVAGLNQTEVALALGMTAPVARRRIVQGLQIFGRRYEATLASLGLPRDFADAEAAHVQFTESGAVVARSGVPDETGATDGASVEEDALRREREVTGTLVVPTRALPALEEFFAAESASPAEGVAAASGDTTTGTETLAMPSPLDPLAAAAVFISYQPLAAADAVPTAGTPAAVEPEAASGSATPEEVPATSPMAESASVVVPENAAPVGEHLIAANAARDANVPVATTVLGVPAEDVAAEESVPLVLPETRPERAAVTARIVPVLAAIPDSPQAASPTRPLGLSGGAAVADEPFLPTNEATASTIGPDGAEAEPATADPDEEEDDTELLIEWGSNPQIPLQVRSDLKAVLTPPDAGTLAEQHDESDWLLVLEDERDDTLGASLESRRRRILSADGEAEDPDESMW
jgi:RNA polymerase sigma factor (sigma-70 family)